MDQLMLSHEEDQKTKASLEAELAKVLKQNEEYKRQLSLELSFKKEIEELKTNLKTTLERVKKGEEDKNKTIASLLKENEDLKSQMKQATILQKELEDLKEKFANTMNILRKRENDNINQQQVFAGLSAQLENAQKENIALKQKLETLSKEYGLQALDTCVLNLSTSFLNFCLLQKSQRRNCGYCVQNSKEFRPEGIGNRGNRPHNKKAKQKLHIVLNSSNIVLLSLRHRF
jgi:antitoxin (DNA-binding transcriptional repressor) of toxin-antitoxin stability system